MHPVTSLRVTMEDRRSWLQGPIRVGQMLHRPRLLGIARLEEWAPRPILTCNGYAHSLAYFSAGSLLAFVRARGHPMNRPSSEVQCVFSRKRY